MAADIRVMSGGAPKEVLAVLTPEFEKQTGHKVHFTYIVISAIQQRLAAGEKPDMVLMPAPALEAQVKAGVMRDAPRPNLGIVRIGLVVREGAPKPDISTLDAFKKAMLDAKSVVHANPAATPSGAHLAKVWEQLGIADAIKAKATHRTSLDGGVAAISQGRSRDRALSGERDHFGEGRDARRPDPGGGPAQHRLRGRRARGERRARAGDGVRQVPRRSGERAALEGRGVRAGGSECE